MEQRLGSPLSPIFNAPACPVSIIINPFHIMSAPSIGFITITRKTTFCGSELKKKGCAGRNMDSLTVPRVGAYNIK